MEINFDKETGLFTLSNRKISYIMQVVKNNYLAHIYFGKKIDDFNPYCSYYEVEHEGAPQPEEFPEGRRFSLECLPQEMPAYGCGDFKYPALQVRLDNGTSALDLRYERHEIYAGKKALSNLPSAYVNEQDAKTLVITLSEVSCKFKVEVSYTIIEDEALIIRSAKIINTSDDIIKLHQLSSMCLDFADGSFDRVHMYGSHANERNLDRVPLNHGIDVVSSARGATSHQHNNFLALCSKDANEDHGEIFASTLIWSGNFEAVTELSCYGYTRMVMGINSFDFEWQLAPQESFTAPEAVIVYADDGFNGMSKTFHHFVKKHIVRGVWKDKVRPVLANSWEAAYFDFNQDSIVRFAKDAVNLGVELIVLDDGWFGHRDDDKTSLGDWDIINKKKLPHGLKGLSDEIHNLGAKFGLWIEPEMISFDSELFKKHPDWALSVPLHKRSTGRDQYVLDLSRKEIRDHIVEVILKVLSSAPIDYVKWDMNRNLTEIGSLAFPASQQGEIVTRYVLGLYDIVNRITKAFPNILFESCSGGGRRFDMGMLCYMPQVWTSDNTDAVARQRIQYGTSYLYPPVTMGAHVSAVPNHQLNRITSMLTRFTCAMSGNFGYEMDLGKLSLAEQEEVKFQISIYKKYRETLQKGDFIRLISPFDGEKNETSWEFVSTDKSEVVLMYFRNLVKNGMPLTRIRFKGLKEDTYYQCVVHESPSVLAEKHDMSGQIFSSEYLQRRGLIMDKSDCDFSAHLYVLREVKK